MGDHPGLPSDQLAGVIMPRRVDYSGKLGLYYEKLYVGTAIRGSEVVVQFDAAAATSMISDPRGVELCRRPLTQFNGTALRKLPTIF